MLFDDTLIDSLPNDPIGGAIRICDQTFEALPHDVSNWDGDEYAVLMECYALLLGMAEASLIDIPSFKFDTNASANIRSESIKLHHFISGVRSACVANSAKQKFLKQKAQYGAMLGAGFTYEFTQGDLDRVQELLNELRVQIRDCPKFAEEHRRRLLLKLEKLQAEVHKKMSSLDNFWGIVLEGGVVLKKLGDDAKPIVDRIRELAGLAWRTQARAEDLPTDATLPMGEVASEALHDRRE